jgi:hypothetical protein
VTALVYGATGWTGSLVAKALARLGVPLGLAGRSPAKLEALNGALGGRASVHVAEAHDAHALERAFAGARVVVSCAGPFVDAGTTVARAAIAAGAHYIDVSGEESHVAAVYALDDEAKARGVSVCPAFAGKGALGDLGAEVAATPALRVRGIDEVAVAYAHGLREATRPSIASILAIAGQGVFHQGASEAITTRSFGFPPPFDRGLAVRVPAAEVISIPRHLRARSTAGFVALAPGHPINEPWARLCVAAAPAIPVLARVLYSEWGRYHLRLYLPPPEHAQGEESFAVSIEVKAGDKSARLGMIARDAYGVTAEVVAVGVERLLAEPRPRPGVLAPAELCEPGPTLDLLQRLGAVQLFGARAAQGWS